MAKQLRLFEMPYNCEFGGSILKGKRKGKRPLSTKHAINVVLRFDNRKCGSLLAFPRQLTSMINKFAVRFNVKIYDFSINSNHIHLLIKLTTRESFGQFTRALCGAMVLAFSVKWLHRPYSRIVAWGKAFQIAKNYVIKNKLEAKGDISYTPRGRKASNISINKANSRILQI